MTLLTAGLMALGSGILLHLYMRRKYRDTAPGRLCRCPFGFHLLFGLRYVTLIAGVSSLSVALFH